MDDAQIDFGLTYGGLAGAVTATAYFLQLELLIFPVWCTAAVFGAGGAVLCYSEHPGHRWVGLGAAAGALLAYVTHTPPEPVAGIANVFVLAFMVFGGNFGFAAACRVGQAVEERQLAPQRRQAVVAERRYAERQQRTERRYRGILDRANRRRGWLTAQLETEKVRNELRTLRGERETNDLYSEGLRVLERAAADLPDGDPSKARYVRGIAALRAQRSLTKIERAFGAEWDEVKDVLRKSGIRVD